MANLIELEGIEENRCHCDSSQLDKKVRNSAFVKIKGIFLPMTVAAGACLVTCEYFRSFNSKRSV